MKSSLPRLAIVVLAVAAIFLWYRFRQPRFQAGETAPDFSITLADSSTLKLSDLRGHYVLLQFWGSWCSPCRQENRALVPLYAKYHPAGFEILSVAMEQSPVQWQRAIAFDKLDWKYHTMEAADLAGPLATLFNVHSIPATFLINPDGKIMGVNRMPEEMDRLLGTHLRSR